MNVKISLTEEEFVALREFMCEESHMWDEEEPPEHLSTIVDKLLAHEFVENTLDNDERVIRDNKVSHLIVEVASKTIPFDEGMSELIHLYDDEIESTTGTKLTYNEIAY